jgi:ribosomal-protein-alanine N-acetyltransferase
MQNWVAPVTLTGVSVRLEPLELRHAPGLLSAASPELFRFTPQGPDEWTVAGFERDIERVNAIPDSVAFAAIELHTGRVIGRTTYMEIRPEHRGLEIGRTWIAREHQGTHINPEMKYLMLRHAFEHLQAVRVQLKTGHENLQSQRAIARLGAVLEGVLRNHMIEPNGRLRNTVMFSITIQEWPGIRASLQERLGGRLQEDPSDA